MKKYTPFIIITILWTFTIAICLAAYGKQQSEELYTYTTDNNKVEDIKDIGNLNILSNIINLISLALMTKELYKYERSETSYVFNTPFIFGCNITSCIIGIFVFIANCKFSNCFNVVSPLYILLLIHIFLIFIVMAVSLLKIFMSCLANAIKPFCVKYSHNGYDDQFLAYTNVQPINSI